MTNPDAIVNGTLPELARQEVGRITGSELFRRSERLQAFLRHVVGETLAGRGDRLKAYNIGIEVFGRPDGFDADKDAIVRVEAQRMRGLLERYYLGEGKNNPARIDMPKGQYCVRIVTQSNGSQTPSRPSLAVLPLQNFSDDPKKDYIGNGLVEELCSLLGSCPEIEVISQYAINDLGIKGNGDGGFGKEGNALGVGFILQGSFQIKGDQLRVTLTLNETEKGRQLWSKRYNSGRCLPDLFEVQEEIARDVVASVSDRYGGAINRQLSATLLDHPAKSMTEYVAILKLHHYNGRMQDAGNHAEAVEAFEKSVAENPKFALGWAALGELRIDRYSLWSLETDRDGAIAEALAHVGRAIALDTDSAYHYWVRGLIHEIARRPEATIRDAERILKRDPDPSSKALGAWLLSLAGEGNRGLPILREQMEILKHAPSWWHHPFVLDALRHGEFAAALDRAERFCDGLPGFFWGEIDRCAALSALGRLDEAADALARIEEFRPGFQEYPRRFLECHIMQDEILERVMGWLVDVGLPG